MGPDGRSKPSEPSFFSRQETEVEFPWGPLLYGLSTRYPSPGTTDNPRVRVHHTGFPSPRTVWRVSRGVGGGIRQ